MNVFKTIIRDSVRGSSNSHSKMYRMGLLPVLLVASFYLSGCINSGAFYAANVTSVELGDGNFQIVATNVQE